MGDTAYGDGGTRQAFVDAGRKLVARVPGRPNRKHFPKEDFAIDLVAGTCRCPARQVTSVIVAAGKRTDGTGATHRLQAFRFEAAVCWACPLRSQCIAAKGRKGRQVLIHPQEPLLQEARALQQSADYDQYRRRRVVAEHRLARLEQLGIRQARYFGRVKTKFQLYLAATVANLTLLANQIGVVGDPDQRRLWPHHWRRCWPGSQRSPPPVANLDAGLVQVADMLAAIAFPNQGFPARFLGTVPSGRY